MSEHATDEDLKLLGELGVDTAPEKAGGRSAPSSESSRALRKSSVLWRSMAGRLCTVRTAIFSRRFYAVRLDRMRESAECREVLKGLDPQQAIGHGR